MFWQKNGHFTQAIFLVPLRFPEKQLKIPRFFHPAFFLAFSEIRFMLHLEFSFPEFLMLCLRLVQNSHKQRCSAFHIHYHI